MKLATFFEKLNNWRYLVISLILFVFFNILIFIPVNRFLELTDGVGLIEIPSVVSEDLYSIVASYPPQALDLYKTVIQPLDILFPLSLGFFLVTTLSMLTARIFPRESKLRLLPALGILPTLADWWENLWVRIILNTVNSRIEVAEFILKFSIILKSLIAFLAILTIIILLIILLIKKIKKYKQDKITQAK